MSFYFIYRRFKLLGVASVQETATANAFVPLHLCTLVPLTLSTFDP